MHSSKQEGAEPAEIEESHRAIRSTERSELYGTKEGAKQHECHFQFWNLAQKERYSIHKVAETSE